MRAIAFPACLLAFAAASAVAGSARSARACGGCFIPPRETTVVTDHRMAFSLSTQQTVLWDQIKYSGAPQDFAWVLPVQPGTRVELSHDEWFAALDAVTAPQIAGPRASCGGSGFGCGASVNSAAAYGPTNGGVQVVSQGVVGPYDTVTLRSTDPNALYDWLRANGYDIPDSIRPTIDAYVAGGFDFIALRLQPGQGVQAMKPVRVVTQGADPTLPLRMVAAGVGAQVGITLYVIGEGRYEAANFPNATIDDSQLVWLHAQGRSNYQELAEQAMQQQNGRTWLTEYAEPASLTPTSSSAPSTYCPPYGTAGGPTVYYYGSGGVADIYLAQCRCSSSCSRTQSLDASLDGALFDAPFEGGPGGGPGDASGADASDDAAPDSGGDASDDGGFSSGDDGGSCHACEGFDDLDVALVGLHPADVWVTRMRALLPANALSAGDLVLQASASQRQVFNLHDASRYDDPSYDPCGSRGGGCSAGAVEPSTLGRWLVVAALALPGVALVRRRRARR
jgi:hypothetical protein